MRIVRHNLRTKKDLQIVIPIYKNTLTHFESVSLNRSFKVFEGYHFTMIKPHNLDTSELERKYNFSSIEAFDKKYFHSISGYNELMLSYSFYKRFDDSKYMLILQPDVYVFFDNLSHWINKEYDYVGAPWISSSFLSEKMHLLNMYIGKLFQPNRNTISKFEMRNRVGNGGFSIRNIATHKRLCKQLESHIDYYLSNLGSHNFNEDVFWSMVPQSQGVSYSTPALEEAMQFSFDINPERLFKMNQQKLPMACHGWYKRKHINFWLPIISKEEGFDISLQ